MNESDKKLKALAEAWAKYREFLEAKYKPEPDEEWKFICPHHAKIDEILKDIL